MEPLSCRTPIAAGLQPACSPPASTPEEETRSCRPNLGETSMIRPLPDGAATKHRECSEAAFGLIGQAGTGSSAAPWGDCPSVGVPIADPPGPQGDMAAQVKAENVGEGTEKEQTQAHRTALDEPDAPLPCSERHRPYSAARQCTVVPRSGRRGRRFKSCHPCGDREPAFVCGRDLHPVRGCDLVRSLTCPCHRRSAGPHPDGRGWSSHTSVGPTAALRCRQQAPHCGKIGACSFAAI
jgi:hypothetical protein